jgi:hypothetical protein
MGFLFQNLSDDLTRVRTVFTSAEPSFSPFFFFQNALSIQGAGHHHHATKSESVT